MIETTSGITLIYARAIGGALIVVALAGVLSPSRFKPMIEEIKQSPGLVLISGLLGFGLGGLILGSHPYWDDALSVIVSMIGWASLIKGAALILAPDAWLKLAEPALRRPDSVRLVCIGLLLVGVALASAGFIAQARYA